MYIPTHIYTHTHLKFIFVLYRGSLKTIKDDLWQMTYTPISSFLGFSYSDTSGYTFQRPASGVEWILPCVISVGKTRTILYLPPFSPNWKTEGKIHLTECVLLIPQQ